MTYTISCGVELTMPKETPESISKSVPRIPFGEALKLRYQQGLNYTQLAEHYHVSPQAVRQRFQKFESLSGRSEETSSFKELRADILAGLQLKILLSFEDAEIKKASFQSKMTAFGILFDKEKIERGQSLGDNAPRIVINIAGQNIQVGLTSSSPGSKAVTSDNPTIECSVESRSE